MPIRDVHVSVRPHRTNEPMFDEFAPMHLAWREPGFIYRWCDRHPQVLPTRVRQGWKICSPEDDFRKRGCPESLIPESTGGQIIFGDSILCKMPQSLYNKRYKHEVVDRIAARRLSNKQAALAAGEAAASELRARGMNVPDNLVQNVSEREIERDWNKPWNVEAKDGQHVADPNFNR